MDAAERIEAEAVDKWAFISDPKRNWQEDYPHENGNYACYCMKCKLTFMGYKRRTLCRKCCPA